MFDKGDIIDNKYLVEGLCSSAGGMGTILFVTPVKNPPPFKLVLKYCKDTDDERVKRFRREVRLLKSFKGNSKIVQVFDHGLDHEPPYFVMKYYADGDLKGQSPHLQIFFEAQEKTFLKMIDCLQELHSRKVFHRDIKPENFLVDGEQIVVSDFGLTTEVGSDTAFTHSSMKWVTYGYSPPEFLDGSIKSGDAASDIFMLGKTMYAVLTLRDPTYLMEHDVPAAIFHVIDRCCSISKAHRYQSLADLKQSVVAAYDVLLERGGGIDKVKQLLSAINDRIEQESKYHPKEIAEFVEQLALLEEADQIRVGFELPKIFFSVIRQESVIDHLPDFLSIYEKLVDSQNYSWSYAETVATNMQTVFNGDDVPIPQKAVALDLAIRAACYMNRFAAMDTCKSMITSVQDETLGLQVASVLSKHCDTFAARAESSECKSDSIRNVLRQLQNSS